ncbi:MAG: arylsulfotransferase family protein [Acidobacteriota bacterium]
MSGSRSPVPRRPRRLALRLLVGSLLALAAVAALVVGLARHDETPTDPTWTLPPGAWNRLALDDAARGATEEDLAQLLSLPYSAGGAPAESAVGVVHHDGARAHQGLNLYVSGHGTEVILVTMDGDFVHRWRRAFTEVFPERPPGPETDFIRRARLLDDGSVVVLYQGGGLARLAPDSEVIWAVPGAFFNDFDLGGDRLFAIGKSVRRLPAVRTDGPVLEDFVAVLDAATGTERSRTPLLPAFRRSGFEALLEPLPPIADIFHSNTIAVLGDPAFDGAPPGAAGVDTDDGPGEQIALGEARHRVRQLFAPGRLLLSLREIDTLALLDLDDETIVWAQRGPWMAQHEPVPIAGERLLLFDNRGGTDRHSRVLLWDLVREEIAWSFEHPRIHSPLAGTVATLGAAGHLLVTASGQGRALELDDRGSVVWEWVSPHRAGDDDQLVATLFEIQRLESARPGGADLEALLRPGEPQRR